MGHLEGGASEEVGVVGKSPAAEGAGPCEEGDPVVLRACPVREGRSLADEGEQIEAYGEATEKII